MASCERVFCFDEKTMTAVAVAKKTRAFLLLIVEQWSSNNDSSSSKTELKRVSERARERERKGEGKRRHRILLLSDFCSSFSLFFRHSANTIQSGDVDDHLPSFPFRQSNKKLGWLVTEEIQISPSKRCRFLATITLPLTSLEAALPSFSLLSIGGGGILRQTFPLSARVSWTNERTSIDMQDATPALVGVLYTHNSKAKELLL